MRFLSRYGFFVWFFAVLFACTGLLSSSLYSAEVNSGRPNSFEVELPGTSEAGTPFQVKIRVLDSEGNLVKNYNQLERNIKLEAVGSGQLSQTSISSTQFSNGQLSLSMTYNKAEEIQITVKEVDHVARGTSNPMPVRPGQPAGFEIEMADVARAGEPFTVELTAVDRFGNRVTDYSKSTNGLLLETTGVESPSPGFLSVDGFRKGRLETSIQYDVAETIRLVVIDEVNGIEQQSAKIEVSPGALRDIKISVPNQATAGEPFQAAVEMKDRFGNIVTDYPQKGRGVDLLAEGDGELDPDYLPPEEFTEGVAFTEFTYTKTDPLRIRARDRSVSAEGISNRIQMRAGSPATFVLKAPDEVEAGQEFDVTIEVQDRFGNRVRRYNKTGAPVTVNIAGDSLSTKTITPEQFDEARATVTLTQKEAGSVRVKATTRFPDGQSLSGQSRKIVVVPGPPGNIELSTPVGVMAGENFSVNMQLQDEFGNPIRSSESLAGEIYVNLLDHGGGTEQSIRARQLVNGTFTFSLSHTRAEDIRVFAEYRNHDIRTQSDTIQVTPAPFDHFAIRAPGEVQAGNQFTIGFQMRDQFGNPLQTMPENLTPVHLFSTGSDNLEPVVITSDQISVPNFTITAQYYVSELMAVRLRDRQGRQVGVSPPIRITPGELASFRIDVPDQVRATKSFPTRLEAVDNYNNVITDLNQREGEVVIAGTGSGNISPGTIPYSRFVNGVTELNFDYHTAETIRLKLRADGVETESPEIDILPGPPENFDVAMQNRVRAGKPFPATIEVFDRYGNKITRLPSDFYGVQLESNGSRRLSPGRIDRSLFENGKAEIYIAYPRTGQLSVNARSLSQPLQRPTMERFFIERDRQVARIHLLSSHRPPVQLEQTPGADRLQIVAQPAELITTRDPVNYEDWFIKRIQQNQARFQPLPNVVLSIFPRKELRTKTNFNQNLFTLELSATKQTQETISLEEIRNLIDQNRYEEASTKLDRYLDRHPNDQQANQLQLRLERVRELMSP